MFEGREGDSEMWEQLSFLATPPLISDWRMVVLFDVAAETGVLDALPADPGEIGARLGLDERAVRIVLDALAVWDLVASDSGRWFLGPGAPNADEAAVLHHHAGSLRMWNERIEDRLRGREPQPNRQPPRHLGRWLQALAVNARASAPAAVDACLAARPQSKRVLDLGGGHGEYALEFTRRGLQATVQDRPEVIELARGDGRLPAEGVRLFAGDFFEVLADGPFDLVFCAGVAYTLDPARNVELWRRVRPVLAHEGMLAIHTFLRGRRPLAPIFAVQMLGVGTGGDTHAEEDFREWLGAAGYGRVDVVHLDRDPESVLLVRA